MMFSSNTIKTVLKASSLAILLSCSNTTEDWTTQTSGIVWPAAPAEARISHLRSFSTPEEVGIYPGFWQRVGEFFTGEEDRKLIRPMSVAVTPDRKIYVADPDVNGVHLFDLEDDEYDLITEIDGYTFVSPVALAIGKDNSILVADSVLGSIFQIDPDGDRVTKLISDKELKRPTGIAYSKSTGNIYVSDTTNHQVRIYSKDGILVKTIGERGSEYGQLNYPTYLWLDADENLLVTDSLNFRVQRFDKEGKFLNLFGQPGNAAGNLARPKGIASSKYGDIFVVDALFNAVQIFNSQGNLLLPIGHQGQQAGEFWLPTGIFITDKNEIFIADSFNRRVQILGYVKM